MFAGDIGTYLVQVEAKIVLSRGEWAKTIVVQ